MHRIHVQQGMEYQGETYTYIWCECTVPEGWGPHLAGVYTWSNDFYPWFTGESLQELAAWLSEHEGMNPASVIEEDHG